MIKFGTSGWRGKIADEFTFKNVNAVSKAIALSLRKAKKDQNRPIRIAISSDPRFLSETFVVAVASTLRKNGIEPIVLTGFAPTPVLSFTIIRKKLDGGINITASHNPPEWSGIKFTTERGAPAPPEVTREIEQLVEKILADEEVPSLHAEACEEKKFDPIHDYLKRLEELIDFRSILRSKIKVAIDPMHGTGIRYFSEIMKRHKIEFEIIHDWRDVLFGGRAPDPSDQNLKELKGVVRKKKMDIGIAVDGDGDRYGIIDGDGSFIHPNLILGLLADYLIWTRGWKSGVGLSVATGHLIKEVAKKNGIPVYVTPVGFKYLGDLITEGKAFIVGEESAGLSIHGHTPEKDGILAALLVLEMVSKKGKGLKNLRDDLFKKVGAFYTERVNIPVTREIIEGFDSRVKVLPSEVGGKKVREIDEMDGTKILLEDSSWILYRKSGTEPVVRLYAEAHSQHDLSKIVADGKRFLLWGLE